MPTFALKKRGFEARLRRAHAVLLDLFPKGTKLTLDGLKLKSDELHQRFAQTLARFEAVREAKLGWEQALRALHADLEKTAPLLPALRSCAQVQLGRDHPGVEELGFTVKPRRKLSAAEKALAAAKAKQTRKLRGTLGKKQRRAIKADPGPTLLVLGPNGKPLGDGKP